MATKQNIIDEINNSMYFSTSEKEKLLTKISLYTDEDFTDIILSNIALPSNYNNSQLPKILTTLLALPFPDKNDLIKKHKNLDDHITNLETKINQNIELITKKNTEIDELKGKIQTITDDYTRWLNLEKENAKKEIIKLITDKDDEIKSLKINKAQNDVTEKHSQFLETKTKELEPDYTIENLKVFVIFIIAGIIFRYYYPTNVNNEMLKSIFLEYLPPIYN